MLPVSESAVTCSLEMANVVLIASRLSKKLARSGSGKARIAARSVKNAAFAATILASQLGSSWFNSAIAR